MHECISILSNSEYVQWKSAIWRTSQILYIPWSVTSKYLCCFNAFIFYWIYNKSSHFQINKWTMQIFFYTYWHELWNTLAYFLCSNTHRFCLCSTYMHNKRKTSHVMSQWLRPIGHHHFFLLYELLYLFYMYLFLIIIQLIPWLYSDIYQINDGHVLFTNDRYTFKRIVTRVRCACVIS